MLSNGWIRINGSLLTRREILLVLNLREPKFTSVQTQIALIKQANGAEYYNQLMIKYGHMSDGMLQREVARLDTELDYELERIFSY